jgi:biopolymer transport protein TolQ
MSAFQSLGTTGQPTLALVAPAISEALVATAMGLFAAIPAVIAYNRFAAVVDHRAGQYEAFIEDFMSLLQRQAHAFRSGLGRDTARAG